MSKFSEMPYSRCFVPQKDGFAAYIREFPGCLAEGRTLAEAYKNLEKVADSWVEVALSQGQTIPLPLERSWPKDQEGEFVRVRREDLIGKLADIIILLEDKDKLSNSPGCAAFFAEQDDKEGLIQCIKAALTGDSPKEGT